MVPARMSKLLEVGSGYLPRSGQQLALDGEHEAEDLIGRREGAVESRVHDRRILAASGGHADDLAEPPARLLVATGRISSGSASSSAAA